MRSRCRRLRRGLLAALALSAAVSPLSARQYDVALERGVMMPMRDGVRLATDLYRPARDGRPADGRFPAILLRTPYGKATALRIP